MCPAERVLGTEMAAAVSSVLLSSPGAMSLGAAPGVIAAPALLEVDIIAIVAVAVSSISLLLNVLLARWIFRGENRSSAVASSFALMASAEAMLKDIPTGLKFHGITEQDLADAGLTAEEFAYVLVNFTSAGVYYRINDPHDVTAFPRDSYRHVMLSAPATQRAWPLLKKLINPQLGSYGKKIEATLAAIEQEHAGAPMRPETRPETRPEMRSGAPPSAAAPAPTPSAAHDSP